MLLGDDPRAIASIRLSPRAAPSPIHLWDGDAGERAAAILAHAVTPGGSKHLAVAT